MTGRRPTFSGPSRAVTLLGALVCIAGCQNGGADPHITQIQELQDQLSRQGRQLGEKDAVINEQAAEIQHLRGLDADDRLKRLVHVDRIELQSLSGPYDDNRDGVDDGMVAYLRLIDADGDTIKAAGSATVQLFDLAAPQGGQLIGGVNLGPDELRPLWYGCLFTSHYTIRVPWKERLSPGGSTVTMVVRFTDLLTGRSFETQTSGRAQAAAQ